MSEVKVVIEEYVAYPDDVRTVRDCVVKRSFETLVEWLGRDYGNSNWRVNKVNGFNEVYVDDEILKNVDQMTSYLETSLMDMDTSIATFENGNVYNNFSDTNKGILAIVAEMVWDDSCPDFDLDLSRLDERAVEAIIGKTIKSTGDVKTGFANAIKRYFTQMVDMPPNFRPNYDSFMTTEFLEMLFDGESPELNEAILTTVIEMGRSLDLVTPTSQRVLLGLFANGIFYSHLIRTNGPEKMDDINDLMERMFDTIRENIDFDGSNSGIMDDYICQWARNTFKSFLLDFFEMYEVDDDSRREIATAANFTSSAELYVNLIKILNEFIRRSGGERQAAENIKRLTGVKRLSKEIQALALQHFNEFRKKDV